MNKAKRFRSGDFVKGQINDEWVVGKVANKTNMNISIHDRFGQKYTLEMSETYKSSKEEWKKWGKTAEELSQENEIEQGKKEMVDGWINSHAQKSEPKKLFYNRKNIKMGLSTPECKEDMPEVLNPVPETSNEIIPKTKKVKIEPDISKYVRHNIKTASGKKKMDNNDDVSKLLRSCPTIVDVYAKVFEVLDMMKMNKFSNLEEMVKKYEHLNVGQQRMCAGNLIRGAKKKIGIENLDEIFEQKR